MNTLVEDGLPNLALIFPEYRVPISTCETTSDHVWKVKFEREEVADVVQLVEYFVPGVVVRHYAIAPRIYLTKAICNHEVLGDERILNLSKQPRWVFGVEFALLLVVLEHHWPLVLDLQRKSRAQRAYAIDLVADYSRLDFEDVGVFQNFHHPNQPSLEYIRMGAHSPI